MAKMKHTKVKKTKQVEQNILDFTNKIIFIGMDVHKKDWKIAIYFQGMLLQTLSMDPSPEGLVKYLEKNYPGGRYTSVYEAGFCGYWIDRELRRLGVKNIVVNPSDVPSRSKERRRKTDKIDARKLGRELCSGNLQGIYIPTEQEESIRALSRLRKQITRDQTRTKNRIKSFLNYLGQKVPENHVMKHWSGRYIKYLEDLQNKYEGLKYTMDGLLENLRQLRMQLANITRELKSLVEEKKTLTEVVKRLMSVPGIGFITAITIYAEILQIRRFRQLDEISSYVGFSPATASSGDKEKDLGLDRQQNKYLRNMIIESAWIAVRKDLALTMAFGRLLQRMSKQEAIIRISKKLLNRIMYVWKNNEDYVCRTVS
jgi:transposase